jgi:hypothetical protein
LDDQKFLVKSWDKNAPFRSRQNDRTWTRLLCLTLRLQLQVSVALPFVSHRLLFLRIVGKTFLACKHSGLPTTEYGFPSIQLGPCFEIEWVYPFQFSYLCSEHSPQWCSGLLLSISTCIPMITGLYITGSTALLADPSMTFLFLRSKSI